MHGITILEKLRDSRVPRVCWLPSQVESVSSRFSVSISKVETDGETLLQPAYTQGKKEKIKHVPFCHPAILFLRI